MGTRISIARLIKEEEHAAPQQIGRQLGVIVLLMPKFHTKQAGGG
jgi:hypothetical protein